MATKYQRNFDHCYPFSDTGAMMLLAANTALTYTVPGTANQIYRARFSYDYSADIWVSLNGTAVGPTSNTVTSTHNQEYRPDVKYVKGGDVLSFISSGTPQVGVSLLMVQDIT